MTYITGSHIQRRTFLKGMGASVALPFLDGDLLQAGDLDPRVELLYVEA